MVLAGPPVKGTGQSAHPVGYMAGLGSHHGQSKALCGGHKALWRGPGRASEYPKGGLFLPSSRRREINFYQVIPLHREELEYKVEHNAEALLEKLAEADFVVHPDRPADLL